MPTNAHGSRRFQAIHNATRMLAAGGALLMMLAAQTPAHAQAPLSTGWTYQGRLQENGAPASAEYDLRFTLFDAPSLGAAIGSSLCFDGVVPSEGLFSVTLDFGASAFDGSARWMQIEVRSNAIPGDCSSGPYTLLGTRQPLTATPYALYAVNGPAASGPWSTNGANIHNNNAGNVGIGSSSPAHKLDVLGDVRVVGRSAFGNNATIGLVGSSEYVFDFSHRLTDFSSTHTWPLFNSYFNIEPTFDLTGPSATYFYSHDFGIIIPPHIPHDVRYLQGPYVLASNNGTGRVDILAGAFISAQSQGDATEHLACEMGGFGYGNARLTNNYALSLRTGHNGTTGKIDNNYGLYLGTPEIVASTIDRNTGVYIANQGASGSLSNWAIYSDGGKSYFADGIHIGTTLQNPYKLTAINQTEHAIFGKVEADSGAFAYGVYGQSDSASGGGGVFGIAPIYGVHGLATAASGTSFGGYFRADSPDGWAGYFQGRGYFSGNVGLGTTSPGARLHIEENTPVAEALYARNTGAGRAASFESLTAGGPSAVACYKRLGNSLLVFSDLSGVGAPATDAPLAIAGGSDTALSGGGFLVSGSTSSTNLSIDNNEIMARNNGAAATLAINAEGGNVNILQAGTGNVGIGTASPTLAKVQINVADQRCLHGTNNSPTFATGYFVNSGTGPAGVFDGNVTVIGTLSKSGGSFRIDHPLDPANKYLSHSFVESPDMKNLYDGIAVTDERGYATIQMPDWFEPLNREFRYQLTVIDDANRDEFVLAKVVRQIADGKFTIRTSRGNATVCWQVTGTRQDAWAEAHRIPIEHEKPAHERGKFLHPALFGAPRELGIYHEAPADAAETQSEIDALDHVDPLEELPTSAEGA